MTTFKSLVHISPSYRKRIAQRDFCAVAFATGLVFGEPPGQYHFARKKMSRHLWSCFERRQISMFLYRKLRRATESTVKSVKSQYTPFLECQSCKIHIGSSALAVRGGTTQIPASVYHIQLSLATLHGTATDVYKLGFF